jgi:hypothetical protein
MRIIRFDSRQAEQALAFRWLYCAFNCKAEQRSTDQINRNLEILELFHEISTPDETTSWAPYVEEARALKPGPQQLALTDAQYKVLEQTLEAAETMLQPVAVLRYLRPTAALLRAAPREAAEGHVARRRKP